MIEVPIIKTSAVHRVFIVFKLFKKNVVLRKF